MTGILCVLRFGAPWRDLPERCGIEEGGPDRCVVRSRGGLTTKIPAVVGATRDGRGAAGIGVIAGGHDGAALRYRLGFRKRRNACAPALYEERRCEPACRRQPPPAESFVESLFSLTH